MKTISLTLAILLATACSQNEGPLCQYHGMHSIGTRAFDYFATEVEGKTIYPVLINGSETLAPFSRIITVGDAEPSYIFSESYVKTQVLCKNDRPLKIIDRTHFQMQGIPFSGAATEGTPWYDGQLTWRDVFLSSHDLEPFRDNDWLVLETPSWENPIHKVRHYFVYREAEFDEVYHPCQEGSFESHTPPVSIPDEIFKREAAEITSSTFVQPTSQCEPVNP